MNDSVFSSYKNNINHLTDKQFLALKSKIKQLAYGKFLATNIDESTKTTSCKHCNSSDINKWGRRDNMQRYKCKDCKKTFNSLTGSPLSKLRMKEKWIIYAECLKSGLSIRKSASICGIHKNTSFKWRHRFLQNSTSIKASTMPGISEMDSIIMIKSYKGSKNLQRSPRKRGIKNRTNIKDSFSVFFVKNRASYVYDKIFTKLCNEESDFSLDEICLDDTLLCSKENSIYKNFKKNKKIQHSLIKQRKNKLKNNIIHNNNVKQYHELLLTWMKRFHGVATKYLVNYLAWLV